MEDQNSDDSASSNIQPYKCKTCKTCKECKNYVSKLEKKIKDLEKEKKKLVNEFNEIYPLKDAFRYLMSAHLKDQNIPGEWKKTRVPRSLSPREQSDFDSAVEGAQQLLESMKLFRAKDGDFFIERLRLYQSAVTYAAAPAAAGVAEVVYTPTFPEAAARLDAKYSKVSGSLKLERERRKAGAEAAAYKVPLLVADLLHKKEQQKQRELSVQQEATAASTVSQQPSVLLPPTFDPSLLNFPALPTPNFLDPIIQQLTAIVAAGGGLQQPQQESMQQDWPAVAFSGSPLSGVSQHSTPLNATQSTLPQMIHFPPHVAPSLIQILQTQIPANNAAAATTHAAAAEDQGPSGSVALGTNEESSDDGVSPKKKLNLPGGSGSS